MVFIVKAQLFYFIQCRCCGVGTGYREGNPPLCLNCKRSLLRHGTRGDIDPSWPMVEWAAKRAVRLARRKKVK